MEMDSELHFPFVPSLALIFVVNIMYIDNFPHDIMQKNFLGISKPPDFLRKSELLNLVELSTNIKLATMLNLYSFCSELTTIGCMSVSGIEDCYKPHGRQL